MTRRAYSTDTVDVATGWDRPLQMFFLVVTRRPVRRGHEQVIFSNLDDAAYPWRSVTVVFDRLRTLGIGWPATLRADLEADCAENRGSFAHAYPPVGVEMSDADATGVTS
jgi:hypothetical protein